MKILITGGGGFLGSAIIRQLLPIGHSVTNLSRGSYPFLEALGVRCLQGDIADLSTVERACQGQDLVIHTAAKAGVWGDHRDYYQANVVGTENIVASCRRQGIQKLVYTSSPSVVFGGEDQEGIDESEEYPTTFLASYPKTKAIAEKVVLAANDQSLATVALRPHLIWGPGDHHIMPKVLERARQGKLRLVDSGRKKVDAVFVDNAAHAHILAANRLNLGSPLAGRALFITNHEPWPMADIINGFLKAADMSPVNQSISPQMAYFAGYVLEGLYKLCRTKNEPPMTRFVARQLATAHWYNNDMAIKYLGYYPKISMEEGMSRLGQSLKG